MMVSTRGRYALRVMIDLAEHSDGGYTAMKEVAERQNISLKYLERILPVLVEGGLIDVTVGNRTLFGPVENGNVFLECEPVDIEIRQCKEHSPQERNGRNFGGRHPKCHDADQYDHDRTDRKNKAEHTVPFPVEPWILPLRPFIFPFTARA